MLADIDDNMLNFIANPVFQCTSAVKRLTLTCSVSNAVSGNAQSTASFALNAGDDGVNRRGRFPTWDCLTVVVFGNASSRPGTGTTT